VLLSSDKESSLNRLFDVLEQIFKTVLFVPCD